MSIAPHLAIVLAATLPWLGGCARSPDAAGAAGDAPASAGLRAVAQSFLERLADEQRQMHIVGDEIVEPAVFGTLLRMGSEAVPAILDAVASTQDTGYRDLLIDLLGRIGDARARPALESLLGDAAARTAALDAIGRLGKSESLPALRQLLAVVDSRDRVRVLEAMHRVGDTSVVGDLLRIGLADEEQRFDVERALLRHPPLRVALGFRMPFRDGCLEVFDDALFLQAADEWHHEAVLGRPSPWRPVPPQFTEPLAAEKRAAFARLEEYVAGRNDESGRLRVHGAEPVVTEADGQRSLALLAGSHNTHYDTLVIHVWCPTLDHVVGYRLAVVYRGARTSFPGDNAAVRCTRIDLNPSAYAAMITGLRTVLAARVVTWWSGPSESAWVMNSDFAFAAHGVGDDAASRHCGSESSDARRYQDRLAAAEAWHNEFVDELPATACADVPPEAKARFSSLFASLFGHEQADLRQWMWVRGRMVEMARDAGDDTLRDALVRCLDAELRTAAAAINALAAITGTDLRFHAGGASRPVADVAAAYRQLLAR